MRIYNLNKSVNNNVIKLSAYIESKYIEEKELWFSTELRYENNICTDQYDAFLVGLLYPAMKYGEDIYIEGKVSKKLLHNINHYVIPLIKSFSSSCKQIKVTANELTNHNYRGDGVGTGFSGGVDSFCTIYDHYELENDPDYKINSFLFLNVGAHGRDNQIKVKEKFRLRYEYLKNFPEELGLDFIPIDSNLFVFHPWGHQLTCTLTLVSGILFMQKYYNKYYCASLGWSYLEILEYYASDLDKDIAMFDPILLPLLSTESLELVADGTQYNRAQKTIHILNYEPVHRYLNVCVSGDDTHENCSVCSKCSRTLMALNSVNRLNEFKDLFDIKKYKNEIEKKYIYKQVYLQKKDAFAKSNVELAKSNNIKLPSRFRCFLMLIPSIVINRIKIALSKILPSNIKNIIKKLLK
ncbi:hypothetical protein PBV87_16945 [Niameybacter massiliensis]|uniref:Uncharacterized protein n=1 Tax=Holtiella tumoricola TaxID=3018743 RepID=A0AA42DQL3_9FIRM|nr:hypothetical protein [Holtiella tumoricola]MDA3733166.1 hypothetical protein [Holtiella tumoricola]